MGDTAAEFEWYADWAADVTPIYATLARAAAADDHILDVAAEAPDGQPAPQLLLGAVHLLLLQDGSHPLADYYPTCGGDDSAGDPTPHFREFCRRNERRLRDIVRSRRVQTNAVGRSAVLLPAFSDVASDHGSDSLSLIELGASAGLNLNWDRYQYYYEGTGLGDGVDANGDAVLVVGPDDAPLTIATEARGDDPPPLPQSHPPVAWRVGVDLSPIDATAPDEGRWLKALVPPDHLDRHSRLDASLQVAEEAPPPLVEGDALEELPRLLRAAPERSTVVVFSTHVLYQLADDTVAKLRSLLAEYSTYRDLEWLSNDPKADLETPVYRRVTFRDGDATERRLAQFESYGDWLRWMGA